MKQGRSEKSQQVFDNAPHRESFAEGFAHSLDARPVAAVGNGGIFDWIWLCFLGLEEAGQCKIDWAARRISLCLAALIFRFAYYLVIAAEGIFNRRDGAEQAVLFPVKSGSEIESRG